MKFFNIEVKVVLDRQPLLGMGPCWPARGHAGPMVAPNTFNDNLCL